jgi:hypothetical protein
MNTTQEPQKPASVARVCSRLIGSSEAAIFLVGGKFLYEIKHKNFLLSEMTGILAGTLLMFLGWAVRGLDKSVR